MFELKAQEVLKESLVKTPKHIVLEKLLGRGMHKCVPLEGTGDGEGGMMLYTSGTTNRPVRSLEMKLMGGADMNKEGSSPPRISINSTSPLTQNCMEL